MPSGRLLTYTEEVADEICRRLALGESLLKICEAEGMPPRTTAAGWVVDDAKGFAAKYARAKAIGLEAMNEGLMALTDDDVPRVPGTGAYDAAAVQHRRLQVDTRKWYLSKLAPKLYGDRSAVEVTGADGGPVLIDDTAKAGKLASILAVAASRREAEDANSDLG
jgi:hypothetical protein